LQDPEQLKELFSAFGPVLIRRMFGGAGIFADGLMIALVSDGEIFLKADQQTIPTLEAEGSRPFTYGAKNRRVVMSYWRLPDRLLDDPEELGNFARAALGAAHRAQTKKVKPGKTKKSAAKRKPVKRPAPPRHWPRRRARSRR
jgi:DNA transformation protein